MKTLDRTRRRLNLADGLVVLGLCFLLSIFAAGFFHPDPLLTQEGSYGIHHYLALALQALGVLLVPIAVGLYIAVRLGKLPLNALLLGAFGLFFGGLIIYPVFVELYFSRSQSRLKAEFHPYLQVTPQSFELRPGRIAGLEPVRVVCLGGSTTAWANSKKVRWTELLEERLNAGCPGCDIQVYNQGKDWYTTLHSLINYSANVRAAKPPLVLVMHGINDFFHNADFSHLSNGSFRNDYGHYLGPIARFVQRTGPLSVIYDHFKRHWFAPSREVVDAERFPGLTPFKNNLASIADLVEKDGGQLVLMTEPYLYRPDLSVEEKREIEMFNFEAYGPGKLWSLPTAVRGMAQYNEAIRQVAQERNAMLVDLERVIPKSLDYFVDEVHYADRTYPIIAEQIAQAIQPAVNKLAAHGNAAADEAPKAAARTQEE